MLINLKRHEIDEIKITKFHSPAKKVTQTWLPSHVAKLKRCTNRMRVVIISPFFNSSTPNGDRTTAASSVIRNATIVAFCVKGRLKTTAMIVANSY